MNGTLTLSANGIVLMESQYLTITNNIISTSAVYGIYGNNSLRSVVKGNKIIMGYDEAAIYTEIVMVVSF